MDQRKHLVHHSYDTIAAKWAQEREAMEDPREREWLSRFRASLVGRRVLELGCGGGVVLRQLAAQGLQAVGVDFSRVQLERARVMCPSAALVQADLTEVEFAFDSMDGVVIYDSLWHVPREEHGAVFERTRRWSRVGAPLLVTVGVLSDEEERELNATGERQFNHFRRAAHALCGEPMFYSAWTKEMTLTLLCKAGYDVVGADETPGRALLLLARAS